MRRKAKLFSDFAEANNENKNIRFLTVGLTNETQEGSSIHLYKGGFAVSENFEPPSKPETVTAADINHNSVTLKISPPRFGAENITSYSVEYCVSGEDGWQQKTEAKAEEVTVRDLKPNTEYVFRCRAVTSAGVGPANQVSIKTTSSGRNKETCLAEKLRDKSEKIKSDSSSVYKLPLTEEHMNIDGCRKFNFGEESTRQNRTIILFGATGSGKSTLIDGMINYIVGVEWEDSFRFKFINEDQSTSQAHSQTSEVTVYKINHQDGFKIPFSLTIIDTPGFGDTRGIERDREITEQLRNLFSAQHGVTDIDAVCFVAQAASARLTATQKYVLDSVLSIFGKDVAENIRILVTFADGQRPPVLEAINAAGVPCPKTKDGLPTHFKFNNSALFAQKGSSEEVSWRKGKKGGFDQMFWEMGAESIKSFFAALSLIETKSLTLTKEVLRERKQLENLQEQVKRGLAKLEEIKKKTRDKLKEYEAEISRNENFEFEVTVKKPFQEDISGSGNYITNCQQCHYTCHYPCTRANDAGLRNCPAMGLGGYCTQCPGRCYWNVHFNQKYRWEYKDVKEKRTMKELKEKYQRARGEKMTVQGSVDKLKAEYELLQAEVMKLMENSAKCLNRLK
ncbi:uncharacterized protein LOC120744778 [Simochromis diagramma]|uniref:uncharacterized protein LOC120744778 n=1 Tax=Simochromis diagramma TaxID=43689 RepID=UPI001A7E85F6|nr:uncharacterized protein LOC120744778 [Simochromis diagramma]